MHSDGFNGFCVAAYVITCAYICAAAKTNSSVSEKLRDAWANHMTAEGDLKKATEKLETAEKELKTVEEKLALTVSCNKTMSKPPKPSSAVMRMSSTIVAKSSTGGVRLRN